MKLLQQGLQKPGLWTIQNSHSIPTFEFEVAIKSEYMICLNMLTFIHSFIQQTLLSKATYRQGCSQEIWLCFLPWQQLSNRLVWSGDGSLHLRKELCLCFGNSRSCGEMKYTSGGKHTATVLKTFKNIQPLLHLHLTLSQKVSWWVTKAFYIL